MRKIGFSDFPIVDLGSSLLRSANSITVRLLSSTQNFVAIDTSSSSSSWVYAVRKIFLVILVET